MYIQYEYTYSTQTQTHTYILRYSFQLFVDVVKSACYRFGKKKNRIRNECMDLTFTEHNSIETSIFQWTWSVIFILFE